MSWSTQIVRALRPLKGTEEVRVTVEDEYFPPPPELRELLRGLVRRARSSASGRRARGTVATSRAPFGADRESSAAAEVLAVLAG